MTLCGTPEYLAPELVLSKGHDKAVDYWALGILMYELLVAETPFADPDNEANVFRHIVNSEVKLTFPRRFPTIAKDLVKKLLHPNPAVRRVVSAIEPFAPLHPCCRSCNCSSRLRRLR